MDNLLTNAVNETVKTSSGVTDNVEGFIQKVGEQFIRAKVADFGRMCNDARITNIQLQKTFIDSGNPGGWSEKKDFKFDYTIPTDLYNFMNNLVYKEFWSESNEKVWRSFMKAIVRGDDPYGLLRKVRSYYDTKIDHRI